MILADRVRAKFEQAGHRISPRDDVDERAAAWFLGMRPGTLRNWRSRGCGPQYVKLGAGAFYPIESLLAFVRASVIETEK